MKIPEDAILKRQVTEILEKVLDVVEVYIDKRIDVKLHHDIFGDFEKNAKEARQKLIEALWDGGNTEVYDGHVRLDRD